MNKKDTVVINRDTGEFVPFRIIDGQVVIISTNGNHNDENSYVTSWEELTRVNKEKERTKKRSTSWGLDKIV